MSEGVFANGSEVKDPPPPPQCDITLPTRISTMPPSMNGGVVSNSTEHGQSCFGIQYRTIFVRAESASVRTECVGRIGRARALRAGGREFGSRSSQTSDL